MLSYLHRKEMNNLKATLLGIHFEQDPNFAPRIVWILFSMYATNCWEYSLQIVVYVVMLPSHSCFQTVKVSIEDGSNVAIKQCTFTFTFNFTSCSFCSFTVFYQFFFWLEWNLLWCSAAVAHLKFQCVACEDVKASGDQQLLHSTVRLDTVYEQLYQ